MTNAAVVLQTEVPGLIRVGRGKVRDLYAVGGDALLLVATDRISAFDVVLNQGIPSKGRVLTQLSAFWFGELRNVFPNHLLSADEAVIAEQLTDAGVALSDNLRATLAGRCLLCRRTTPLPIEAVVRGYLSGSGWKEYRERQAAGDARDNVDVWGVPLPPGLRESDKLPAPVLTPSTKAASGHDLPVRREDVAGLIGERAGSVEQAAVALYTAAAERAAGRGIIIADTKFEFGTIGTNDGNRELLLIDEALTPDSSRFWDAAVYEPGHGQPSFDKQFVRDYLESIPGWNKQPPAPDLPSDVIEKTAEKYREAFRRITGRDLD